MVNKESRLLWYIVLDDTASHTTVDIHCECSIDDLKKAINAQRKDIAVSEMTLWKVNKSISLAHREREDLEAEVKIPWKSYKACAGSGDFHFLDPVLPVSFFWKEHPRPQLLHLVVQVTRKSQTVGVEPFSLELSRTAFQPGHLGDHIVPRTELVNLLFHRLSDYRIIQIRGTPACGKTVLCTLLHHHLKKQNVLAYTIQGWRTDKHHTKRLEEICGPFHPTHPTYLLFDAGQDTYRDYDLWNFFFKEIRGKGNIHVALFCSYGSASSPIAAPTHGGTPGNIEPSDFGTPDSFAEPQRLSLLPTTATPLGLYMSSREFEDLLRRYPHALNLADDVKREIRQWSAGHIGGIEYLLDSIRRGNPASMRGGTLYELTKFHDDHTPAKVGYAFRYASGGRGLPEPRRLSGDLDMTAMFRQLLRDGQLLEADEGKFGTAVERAHKSGFIYAKQLDSSAGFVLPTPLHAVSLSWMLVPSEVELPSNLTDLVWKVVGLFKYSQLALPLRRAGPVDPSDTPHEAQYQDEFYRALHDFTKGSVLISPEFASASDSSKAGRIDFYIASKKWGIEITRDGKKLQEHSDRFGTTGAYGRWLTTGEMSDYILLDCRSTKPVKHHAVIPNLFHAVFDLDEAGPSVTVYNNNVEKIITMALLENH